MTRRMIDDSMWANESFAEMPMGARLLLIGIINHADDQGRMKANPAYLRAQIFPYDDISTLQIQEWLEVIQVNDTLILYLNDGKQFLQLINWWKYQSLQYAQPSQHPRPAGWQDRIRRTLTKGVIVTCNWQKVNGDPLPDTCDMDGNPISLFAKHIAVTPVEATETANDSGESLGDYSGESSGDDTTKLNITKLNITKLNTTDNGGAVVVGGFSLPKIAVADVHTLWQNNMPGTMTQIIADELNDFIETYTAPEVDAAIRLAVKANKRSMSYVAGILRKRANGDDRPPPKAKAVSGNMAINLSSV